MIAAADIVLLGGWAAMLVGMILSFLYSGLETGCYCVNKIRLDLRAESGNRAASRLLAMQRGQGRGLIVLLTGNSLANYLASAGLVLMLTRSGWPHPDWYSVAILTPVIFIFCELLPKNLFHRHGETLVYVFSGFLDLSRRAFTVTGLMGLIRAMTWAVVKLAGWRMGPHPDPLAVGRHVVGILAEGRASGALTHTQSVIAERIVNIGRVGMRDVMVPIDEAILVDEKVSIEQIRGLLQREQHPHLGVYSGSRDNIVGALNAYDVLLDEGPDSSDPSAHITPPWTIGQDIGVIDALVRMQRGRERIGFVVSGDGRCVGLVTIKDLVEEIVGELDEC